jgi:hypothetical protein
VAYCVYSDVFLRHKIDWQVYFGFTDGQLLAMAINLRCLASLSLAELDKDVA